MTPSCVSVLNTRYWATWARENDRRMPNPSNGIMGSLKTLEPFVGKRQAAALTQLGFFFHEHYEIPGVGLVLIDQASPTVSLYLGQASVLHWILLQDNLINAQLRSLGVLGWWEAKK